MEPIRSLLFVGGGNMAKAIIKGYLHSGVEPATIAVIEPNSGQQERLYDEFGLAASSKPDEKMMPDVVIWAVKPQLLKAVACSLAGRWPATLHISVAAGVRLSSFSNWLQTGRVVRAMPNTAAMVGAGMTGLLAGQDTDSIDLRIAEKIFSSVGKVLWVKSDEEMNAVTAVSGSGPAYVFHWLEALTCAAVDLGFPQDVARVLILDMVQGALSQASASEASFRELQHLVTSKAGTTEAALHVLGEGNVQEVLIAAIRAARARAQSMSSEFN